MTPRRCVLLLLLVVVVVVVGTTTAVTTTIEDDATNLRGTETVVVAAASIDEVALDDDNSSWYSWFHRQLKHSLDHRWKSTKISDECKKRLGIYRPDDYVDPNEADIEVVENVAEEAVEETAIEEEEAVEDEEKIAEGIDSGGKNRRKFVSYESSKWESGWLGGIEDLVYAKSICQTLVGGKHQKAYVHEFLNMICTARAVHYPDWCYYHDHNHFLWYNTRNTDIFQVYLDKTPMILEGVDPPEVQPVQIDPEKYPDIASKFTFLDETTGETYVEYIEPLVAQLRFPLTECLPKKKLAFLAEFASYVLPPPNFDRVDGRTILYDLGSKDWSRMEYIVEEWAAHGTEFKYMISYAMDGNEVKDDFLQTIPTKHASKIFRHYIPLADHVVANPETEGLFVPTKIEKETEIDDYILLKLDKGSASLKQNMIQYILDTPSIHIDELMWEIDATGNYVMESWFDTNLQFAEISSLTLPEAYQMLHDLRMRGIRAHSWI